MNYTEIVEATKAYADRYSDSEVNANLDFFIVLAEARINRLLKTRDQTAKSFSDVTGNEFYNLPVDYRGMKTFRVHNGTLSDYSTTFTLEYCSADELERRKQNKVATPSYSIEGNEIQIHPIQPIGYTLELTYYQKVPPLNSVNYQNWMSTDHPDIYISGIMVELESFVKNYETASIWDAKMTRSIDELSSSDTKESWSSKSMVIKVQ